MIAFLIMAVIPQNKDSKKEKLNPNEIQIFRKQANIN